MVKNRQLVYLGILGTLTPLSMLIWIWRVVNVESLTNLVPQPVKLLTLAGGVLISVAFAIATIYCLIKSRQQCQLCGREMERQIIQAEKLATVGQLAGGIAHEVNTPASIISGRVEAMLLDSGRLSDPDRSDLDVIKNQAERISQITRGLLLFARRAPMEKTRTELNEIIRESIALIEPQMRKANIEIVREFSAQPILFWGQHNQMIQVLLNLLTNARDAMPEGGRIEIQTSLVNGNGVQPTGVVRVKDTGKGIAPEHLDKIFSPFFTTKRNGTGLGLSVSYGIVQSHGGKIQVKSKVGEGTTFSVLIPLGQKMTPLKDAT